MADLIAFRKFIRKINPGHKTNLKKIDWVIVGGESGRKPRPMNVDWVLDIQQQCEKAKVAFFFKQWGGTNKKKQEEYSMEEPMMKCHLLSN